MKVLLTISLILILVFYLYSPPIGMAAEDENFSRELFNPGNLSKTGMKVTIVDDLDGDGLAEIFTLRFDGLLHGFDAGGNDLPNFPINLAQLAGFQEARDIIITKILAIADINNDGHKEIIVSVTLKFSTESRLFVLEKSGQVLDSWPQKGLALPEFVSYPTICNLDGAGDQEIIVSTDGFVYALNSSGEPFNAHWPLMFHKNLPDGNIQKISIACADIDKDGKKELILNVEDEFKEIKDIVVYSYNGLYAINPEDGSNVWDSPIRIRQTNSPTDKSLLTIGDVNDDGNLDIIVTGSSSSDNPLIEHRCPVDGDCVEIQAIDSTGHWLPNWPQFIPLFHFPSTAALADLNSDGKLEIIFATESQREVREDPNTLVGKVYVYDYTGKIFDPDGTGTAWPKSVDTVEANDVTVGDLDGDGILDIAYVSANGIIYAWNYKGQALNGFPKTLKLEHLSPFPPPLIVSHGMTVISDLKSDGDKELMVTAEYSNCTLQKLDGCSWDQIRSFDLNGVPQVPTPDPWPTFQQNNAHTGVALAVFKRGDADKNDKVDISDAIKTLQYLFLGRIKPACLDAADANDDGKVDISDAQSILNYLFLGGPVPAPPGPDHTGYDPTKDNLGCLD